MSPDHPVVISKFMEEWEEIDADAIADNGEMVMYASAAAATGLGCCARPYGLTALSALLLVRACVPIPSAVPAGRPR